MFPTLAGKSGAEKSGLSMQFKRISWNAGVDILRQSTISARSVTKFTFVSRSLQFTVSNAALANAGSVCRSRQRLIRHSSVEMNRLCTHPTLGSEAQGCCCVIARHSNSREVGLRARVNL